MAKNVKKAKQIGKKMVQETMANRLVSIPNLKQLGVDLYIHWETQIPLVEQISQPINSISQRSGWSETILNLNNKQTHL